MDGPRDEDETTAFRYRPLRGKRTVRFIRIHRPTASDPEKLSCTIVTKDLDKFASSGGSWIAISYTWDEGEEMVPGPENGLQGVSIVPNWKDLRIGDKILRIRTNLYYGLLSIRCRSFDQTEYIWADGICINQKDDKEKNSQIQLMQNIFQGAICVYVWLGRDIAGDSGLVTDALGQLATLYRYRSIPENTQDELRRMIMHSTREMWENNPSEQLAQYGFPYWNLDMWLALAKFLALRWFKRLWCIQEVAIALHGKNAGTGSGILRIVYGDSEIHPEIMYEASFQIDDLHLQGIFEVILSRYTRTEIYHSLLMGISWHNVIWQGCDVGALRRSFLLRCFDPGEIVETPTTVFVQVWEHNVQFEASHAKDRIFAIMGLVTQICSERGLPAFNPGIKYEDSAVSVFTSTFDAILREIPHSGILALCQDHSNSSLVSLPSWVPDFNDYLILPILDRGFNDEENIYNASILQKSIVAMSRSTEGLAVTGIQFSYADLQSPLPSTPPQSFLLIPMIYSMPPKYVNSQPRVEAVWRTMVGDVVGGDYPAPSSCAVAFAGWLEYLYMERAYFEAIESKRLKNGELDGSILGRLIVLLAEASGMDKDSAYKCIRKRFEPHVSSQTEKELNFLDIYSYVFKSNWWRVIRTNTIKFRHIFCTTDKLIGLGPPQMQPGDSIWILAGARTPFVLRRRPDAGEDTYQLIGECYVHGYMHGEVFDTYGSVEAAPWEQVTLV